MDRPGLPPVFKIFPGEVVRLADFGAFVKLPGYEKHGLVHMSQLAHARVENPADVVSVGEKLFVKVLGLGDDPENNPKISLSIKTVNQRTGEDLDPTNISASQDVKAKRQFFDSIKPKTEVSVLYAEQAKCKRCGIRGHLERTCMAPAGGKYALIEEPEEEKHVGPEKSAAEIAWENTQKEQAKALKRAAKDEAKRMRKLEKGSKRKRDKHDKEKEVGLFFVSAAVLLGPRVCVRACVRHARAHGVCACAPAPAGSCVRVRGLRWRAGGAPPTAAALRSAAAGHPLLRRTHARCG